MVNYTGLTPLAPQWKLRFEKLASALRLTERQLSALRRILKTDNSAPISPDVFRQLKAKGLVESTHVFERREWDKVIARLPVAYVLPSRLQEIKKLLGLT